MSFFADESWWIWSSQAYEALIHFDFWSPVWKTPEFIIQDPPLTRYIIAIGRRAGGYQIKDLNKPWNFYADTETNIASGNMPSRGLTIWSRLPMALLTTISGLFLYLLVFLASGQLAAIVFLIFFLTNDYLLRLLSRAMCEAPLLALISIAAITGMLILHAASSQKFKNKARKTSFLTYIDFVFMGILGGLTMSVKLNGIVVPFTGIVIYTLAAFRGKTVHLMKTTIGLILISICTFIAINPYLYIDSFARIQGMYLYRFITINSQAAANGKLAIDTVQEFFQVIPQRIFYDFASIQLFHSPIINIFLCIIGISFLFQQVWRWIQKKNNNYTSAVLISFGLIVPIPSLFTPVDWDRYYLLPVVFTTIFISIGLAQTLIYMINHYLCKKPIF